MNYARIALGGLAFFLVWALAAGLQEKAPELAIVELCDVPAGEHLVRVRGVARVIQDGLLLRDGTCAANVVDSTNVWIPTSLIVARPTFRRDEDKRFFERLQEDFERPVVQLVVRGKVKCKSRIRPSPSDLTGDGFGKVGLFLCAMEGGVVEQMWRLR
jgi:hypothetical protein